MSSPQSPLALLADLQTGYMDRLSVRARTGMGLVCCRSHSLFPVEIRRAEQGKWGWGESTFRREAEEAKLYITKHSYKGGAFRPIPRAAAGSHGSSV